MSLHNHAQHFTPAPPPQSTNARKRALLHRLAILGTGTFAVCLALFVMAMVVGAMFNTEAQLDAVHLQGMQVGMSMCADR